MEMLQRSSPEPKAVLPPWSISDPGTFATMAQWRTLEEGTAPAAYPIKYWNFLPSEATSHAQTPSPTGPSRFFLAFRVWDVTGDEQGAQGDIISLEILAQSERTEDFVQAAHCIDWRQQTAEAIVRGVHQALAVGAHILARHLAIQGAELYPQDPELRKMAHILAPPQVRRTDLPPDPSLAENRRWIHAHADEYRGRWVALHQGTLLAAADSMKELRIQLDTTRGVLITRIL
jgi:hypothetical protein